MIETFRQTYNRLKDSEDAFHAEMRAELPIDRENILCELDNDCNVLAKWGQMAEMAVADFDYAKSYLEDDVMPFVRDRVQLALANKKEGKAPTVNDIDNAVKQDPDYRLAKGKFLKAKARRDMFTSADTVFNTRSFNIKSLNKKTTGDYGGDSVSLEELQLRRSRQNLTRT